MPISVCLCMLIPLSGYQLYQIPAMYISYLKQAGLTYNGAYDALEAIKKYFGGYSPEHDLDIVKAFLKVSSKYGILHY